MLGDFGFVWSQKCNAKPQTASSLYPYTLLQQENHWLQWLSSQPWTNLFIDGNHENFDRLFAYPAQDFHGGKASQVHDSIWYLRRGEVFELCGKKCFVMGGAASIDKQWRVEGESWWAQEVPSEADYDNALANLNRHDNKVDLVLTHTCPLSIKNRIPLHGHAGNISEKLDFVDPTETMLEDLMGRIQFERWYFAHFHLDKEIDERFACIFDKVLQVTE